jgi:hypothetical protein
MGMGRGIGMMVEGMIKCGCVKGVKSVKRHSNKNKINK